MPIAFIGKGTPISTADFKAATDSLGVDAASLWSLVAVETRGFGYFGDRSPQILFERHIFHRRTGGRFSASNPDISNATPGGYAGGVLEYDRLRRAMALDEKAALESASWGLGQIMGFNAKAAGFSDAYAMVTAMVGGEGEQLRAVASFILANKPLRDAFVAKNWDDVAFYYNGASYEENHYDEKLEQHYEVFSTATNQPNLNLRTAQTCLYYLKYLAGGVDGQMGPRTRAALLAYRKAKGMPAGELDDDVLTRLRGDAGI